MKRLILSIVIGAVAALVLNQFYSYFFQYDLIYFRKAHDISSQYEEQLRKDGQPCVIFAGGSEIRAAIRPSVMLAEEGIRAVNAGMAAPNGIQANAAIGLQHVRPGDTFVLSHISTADKNLVPTAGGIKTAVQLYGFSAFHKELMPLNLDAVSLLLSSDAGNIFVNSIRKLTRGYSFIYKKHAQVHQDGWLEVHLPYLHNNNRVFPANQTAPIISNAALTWIKQLQTECTKKGADFIIMIPVGCYEEGEKTNRLLQILKLCRSGINVLRDERLGSNPDTSLYSDTLYHMNARGAAENSRILARLIKEKKYWTEQEILAKMKELGFTEDDTPQLPANAI